MGFRPQLVAPSGKFMKTRSLAFIIPMVIAASISSSVRVARADLALDFTGGTANTFTGSATVGWQFAASSPLTLTALGFWDQGGNGLVNAHQVGIWNSTGTLMASTTVTSASTPVASTSSAGDWLFNSITPVALAPGTYTIGALLPVNADPDFQMINAAASTRDGVTWLDAADVGGSSLTEPFADSRFADGVFGPNLQVTPAPEPSPCFLLTLGTAAAFGAAHRQRSKAVPAC
jgi:hypothetical protein